MGANWCHAPSARQGDRPVVVGHVAVRASPFLGALHPAVGQEIGPSDSFAAMDAGAAWGRLPFVTIACRRPGIAVQQQRQFISPHVVNHVVGNACRETAGTSRR